MVHFTQFYFMNILRKLDVGRFPEQNSRTFKDLGSFQGFSRPEKWNKKFQYFKNLCVDTLPDINHQCHAQNPARAFLL